MLRNCRAIFVSCRFLRTLHQPQRLLDLESQLQHYPPKIRNEVLNKIHQPTEPKIHESGSASRDLTSVSNDQPKLSEIDYLAAIVSGYLQNITTFDELDLPFWQTARTLARSATKAHDPEHLELFSMLFEAAKHISYNDQNRMNTIYHLGRYIYRQKKVRLDPVNEIEFLDALVSHQRAPHALKLWKSRRGRKEVAGSEYWTELGVLYYLDCQLIARANELALSMQRPSIRNISALIAAWARPRKTGSLTDEGRKWLELWTEKLCQELASTSEQLSPDAISPAIVALLATRQWDLAAKLLSSNRSVYALDSKAATAALNASAKRKPTIVERDFVPVLEYLVTLDNDLALQSSLQSSLALHYAFLGERETAQQILDDPDLEKLDMPPAFQVAFSQFTLKNQLNWAEKLKSSPYAILVALRSTKLNTNTKKEIWQATKLDGHSQSVLIEVFRNQIVEPEEMFRLACQHPSVDVWMQLWYMMATRKISLNGEMVLDFHIKLSSAQIGAQHLVYIARALPLSQIIAVLKKAPPGPALSKVSASVFIKSVKNSLETAKTQIKGPTFGLSDHGESEITWEEVADRLKQLV